MFKNRSVKCFILIASVVFMLIGNPYWAAAEKTQKNTVEKPLLVHTEQSPDTASAQVSDTAPAKGPTKLQTLTSILKYIDAAQAEIKIAKKALKKVRDEAEKERVRGMIANLKLEMASHERDFIDIATGIDLDQFDKQIQGEFDLKQQLLELIKPLVNELKNVTELPRQIEEVSKKVRIAENRLANIDEAVVNIGKFKASTDNKKMQDFLGNLETTWIEKKQLLINQLAIAKLQLEEINSEKKPVLQLAQEFFKTFFKTRGKNLLYICFAVAGVIFFLRLVRSFVLRTIRTRYAAGGKAFLKVFTVFYGFFTVFSVIAAVLITLYISGDWALLSLTIIVFLGLAWAAKEGLPRFWEQIQLLLNLGKVRENERVSYKGVLWKVESINFYSQLKNPEFINVTIRLPLAELAELTSSPFHKDDPWFPCRLNDWVILSDGTRGKVVHQCHENVQLIKRGGARKTYLTDEFLAMNPENLSTGFRLKIPFGLDYELQNQITDRIPAILVEFLNVRLVAAGYEKNLLDLKVELETAAASSLDLVIIADFNGEVAALYNKLNRLINKITVEACNENGWNIPFSQMVIHRAE